MKTYKVGVWIDKDYVPEAGGGYGYFSQIVTGLDERFFNNIEICFIGFNLSVSFKHEVINIPFKESFLEKKRTNFYNKLFKINIPRRDIEKNHLEAIEILKKNQIDIIFYATHNRFIDNYPFIIVNWDLGHKTTFSFPEMALNGNWDYREKTIAENLSKALFIAAESEKGKSEIIKNYNIFERKIKILPLFPGKIVSEIIDTTKPDWINKETLYFLYPAQFWAHKNHYNLIRAFNVFIKIYPKYKLILTGSDHGNLRYIQNLINDLEISSSVLIPGYIRNEELKWLYKNAIGLVFPSFLGPTNMPLLEANYFDCNIACSNLEGHRDMLSENAIYFEPENHSSILDSLLILKELHKSGKKLKKVDLQENYSLENSLQILEEIFIESINIRRTWGIKA